jgi:hypothetical protein
MESYPRRLAAFIVREQVIFAVRMEARSCQEKSIVLLIFETASLN